MMVRVGAKAKGVGPAGEFAVRLAAAMGYRGIGVLELARKSKTGRNTVGKHANPPAGANPPSPRIRRKYEQALGLPPLGLDQGTARDVVALLQNAPLRGREPHHAPFEGHGGGLDAAASFVLGQFRVYEKAGLPIPPQIIAVLAGELEAAMGRGEGSSGSPPGVVGSGTLGGG